VAPKDKPYRVYRGGRVKGPAGQVIPRERPQPAQQRDGRYLGPGPVRRKKRRWPRLVGIVLLVVVLAGLAWAVLGYLAFRSGVNDANRRLPRGTERALAPQTGMLLTTPTNVLVLGIDTGGVREGRGRADAIMLVRSDPDTGRFAQLSIPRDLRVEIPGRGADKVNAAYAYGGPALAVDTVEALTGLDVNHVVVVNFASFPAVIDALGGVTINVPRRMISNRFECPYATLARCSRWQGWRFAAGPQRMNGRRALIYARIRTNRLDPRESDFTRVRRQQQVLQAIQNEAFSLGTFLRMPFDGDELARPLATDLSAGELLQLGWRQKRTPSSQTLKCNLGGEIEGGFIQGTEENVSVIAMVTGESAPQPPPPGAGPFAPGCRVGRG
jgi:polyisoprenyl-teichoic acid--peptidoglycan teichoic acid transferase